MIKGALIVAPNAGASLSYGGGCKVAVEMAETLLDNGVRVGLVAFQGFPPEKLDSIHGTNLKRFGRKVRTYYFLSSDLVNGGLIGELANFLPSYFGVIPLIITKHMRRVLAVNNSSLIIFHDDILVNVGDLKKYKAILYAHFPMAARIKIRDPEEREDEQFLRKGMNFFLKAFLKRTIVMDSPPLEVLLANSTITKRYIEDIWGRHDVRILYPPVSTKIHKPSESKENLVVSIGPIQPNKRLGDVIAALSKVKVDYKCIVIGHLRERDYYNYLLNSITRLGLTGKVVIKPNASRDDIISTLSKAKILVHAARFEPFGTAVVEGMASGCVPTVYKGDKSGPWIDVVKRGEYGLGFQTTEELTENIERILSDERACRYYGSKAIERAEIFDIQMFRKKFMEIVESADPSYSR